MNASELRIGNYLICDGAPNPIGVGAIYLLERKEKTFDSIPLTKEWLLKFGFEEYEDPEYVEDVFHAELAFYTFDNNFIYDRILYRNGIWVLKTIEGVSNEKVQHVHQLQNLYYALTGEELNI